MKALKLSYNNHVYGRAYSMTEGYLLEVKGEKIVVPRSKNFGDGDVLEVVVNRVFVDEKMKKKIEKKGVVRIY
jgi:hypothetical protein